MKNKSLRFKILFFLSIVLIIGGFFSLTISAFAQSNAYNYTQLERVPGFEDSGNDLGSYISSIYQFGIWAVGIAAILMITIGGFMYLTSAGNTSKMDVAKRVVTDAIIGLIIALVAYLVLYVINPDLIKINVSMQQLGPGTTSPPGTPGGTAPVGGTTAPPGGTTAPPSSSRCSYATPTAGQNVCAGTACSNSRCSVSTYDSLLTTYAQQSGLSFAVAKAIMCRESGGRPNATSDKGACGLMQVMPSQTGNCINDPRGNLLDPETNIRLGTQMLRAKYNAAGRFSYSGINQYQMAFAAYNCCANNENPNSSSRDCSGLPKWACPINPGTGSYNMCTVKDYACEVSACAGV